MPNVYVARQPICDRNLHVVGYELLFRGGEAAATAGVTVADDDAATSTVLLTAFAEIGLDRLVGDRKAYVNVSRRFLVEGYASAVPPDRVVLEILEDAEVDAELEAVVRRMTGAGYHFALDDFVSRPSLDPLIGIVGIVKVEVLGLAPQELERQVRELAPRGVQLLAEKVETYEEFERCKELGFELFQGFFFCKPKTFSRRSVGPSRLATLGLVADLHAPEAQIANLEQVIAHDVGLSYKLLRYINSAFFALPRTVGSLRQALVLLGLTNIRRWATLLALSGEDEQPDELIVCALVRARLCELVARAYGDHDPEAFFTTGMFSAIDALMDAPLPVVLEELPLDAEIKAALLDFTGRKGEVLRSVLAYERGELDVVHHRSLAGVRVGDLYVDAVEWATDVTVELRPLAVVA